MRAKILQFCCVKYFYAQKFIIIPFAGDCFWFERFSDFPANFPHEKTEDPERFSLIAFFESYFSNYIEGTTFEVSEAADIIFHGKLIPNRTGDTHDVLGTYQLCNDRFEMSRIPRSGGELIEIIRERHRQIMWGTIYMMFLISEVHPFDDGNGRLTRQRQSDGYIRMMYRVHAYSHWLEPLDFNLLHQQLRESNAFKEGEGAALRFPAQ